MVATELLLPKRRSETDRGDLVHCADGSVQDAECPVDSQRAALSSDSCSLDTGVLRPLAVRNRP